MWFIYHIVDFMRYDMSPQFCIHLVLKVYAGAESYDVLTSLRRIHTPYSYGAFGVGYLQCRAKGPRSRCTSVMIRKDFRKLLALSALSTSELESLRDLGHSPVGDVRRSVMRPVLVGSLSLGAPPLGRI